jgi:hypothetical protein
VGSVVIMPIAAFRQDRRGPPIHRLAELLGAGGCAAELDSIHASLGGGALGNPLSHG